MDRVSTRSPQPVADIAKVDTISKPYLWVPDLTDRQWHLEGFRRPGETDGYHLNLGRVRDQYDGSGVTVGIWDDGIDYTHRELAGAYDSSLQVTINGRIHDPLSRDYSSKHGTSVAGIIAAADDGHGTVGIAPGVRLAGVDILSDYQTAYDQNALNDLWKFDVTNHSWGYEDPYISGWYFNRLMKGLERGLERSTTEGRDGLGTINVKSAGNYRDDDVNTNGNVLNRSHHVTAVAALNEDGFVTDFSSPGSTVLVSAFGEYILTTDRRGDPGYSWSYIGNPVPWDMYATFGGTSAAAPQVTAIAALMLEANPGLGWRDVQNILAFSAIHTGGVYDDGLYWYERDLWEFNGATNWNGGGMHYSTDYGFGLVDAHAAIRLAETWTETRTSSNLLTETEDSWHGYKRIPQWNDTGIEVTFTVEDAAIPEMVTVNPVFANGKLHAYHIVLVSPEGTESVLSTPDAYNSGWLNAWTFSSREFLGEDPTGEWTLRISDRGQDGGGVSALKSVDLVISGSPADSDRTLVLTNEYSELAGGQYGHTTLISPRNGTWETLNAAAVTDHTILDFSTGTGTVDGVDVTLRGAFRHVFTGDGNDMVIGGTRGERIAGNRGRDLLDGRDGNDRITGNGGADSLYGGEGFDHLNGGTGRDTVKGGPDNDTLVGAMGADRLNGGSGNDSLDGGTGRDLLRDGTGSDTLTGGAGSDHFILKTDRHTDHILDFQSGWDTIRLQDTRWSKLEITAENDTTWAVHHGDDLLMVSLADTNFNALEKTDFDFI